MSDRRVTAFRDYWKELEDQQYFQEMGVSPSAVSRLRYLLGCMMNDETLVEAWNAEDGTPRPEPLKDFSNENWKVVDELPGLKVLFFKGPQFAAWGVRTRWGFYPDFLIKM